MVRRKKHGKATKKVRMEPADLAEEQFKTAPHTFVFNRGNVGKNITQLMRDVKKVMEPYTAASLKATKTNVLKDFVSIAGMLQVSHFITFSKTEATINMRVMRLPRGPTLTFKLHSYCLSKDVLSSLKRPNAEPKQFLHSPLLVMNNFAGEGMHFKLMTSMFQNMFPSINVNKARLKQIKRCLMLNYNSEDKTIDIRHYNIKAVPAGMSKGVKKLIKSKIPNMGKYEDYAEYIARGGEASESEAEQDGPHNVIELPQNMPGKGNVAAAKSAIRLTEIGPRLKLQLVKIEEGICRGEVLYHEFIQKTEEEIEEQTVLREKKRQLKALRKKQQAENIERKADKKEELKKKSYEGMKDKKKLEEGEGEEEEKVVSEDDDVAYFKEAVGEDPDPELFSRNKSFKRKSSRPNLPFKKRKFEKNSDVSDSKFKSKGNNKSSYDSKMKGQKKPMDKFQKTGKAKKFDTGPRKGAGKRPNKMGKQKQRRKK